MSILNLKTAAIIGLTTFAANLGAATLDMNSITATFLDSKTVNGENITVTNTGKETNLSWNNSDSDQESSFKFKASENNPKGGELPAHFSIGQLTHNNISTGTGTSITETALEFTFDGAIHHNGETENFAFSASFGILLDDRNNGTISVTNTNDTIRSFYVGGDTFRMYLLGFFDYMNGTETSSYATTSENLAPTGYLGIQFDQFEGMAQFRRAEQFQETTAQPSPVPLPASGILLLGAIGAGAALRRKKA